MLGKVLCLASACVAISGFMFNGPCFISPYGRIPESHKFTISENVPANCMNGTFDWNYPKGHVLLHFHNVHAVEMSVCIRDSLGGNVFTITDKASGQQLEPIEHNHWVCTSPTTTPEIVLQLDAPHEMRYMGAVDYLLQF